MRHQEVQRASNSILTVDPDTVTNDMVSKSIENIYKQNHLKNSMNETSISSNINVQRKKRFGRKKKSCYRPSCCVADIKADTLGRMFCIFLYSRI